MADGGEYAPVPASSDPSREAPEKEEPVPRVDSHDTPVSSASREVKEDAALLDESLKVGEREATGEAEKPPRARCRTWLRFWVLWCCCGLASGVLPGQSLFVKLVAGTGVWSSLCDEGAAFGAPPHHRGPGAHHRDGGRANGTSHNGTSHNGTSHNGTSHSRTHRATERRLEERRGAQPVEDTGYDSALHDSEGTCKEQYIALTAVMQLGQSAAYMFIAPIGLFFDRWGPRRTGVAGAALCAFGTLLIWGSLYGAGQGYDSKTMYLFALGVGLCDFGSMLNSFSFMGLIWHFPGQQALILSLINSTYQVSAFLPMAFEWVMAKLDVTFTCVTGGYVAVCLFVTWACWVLVPSQSEYYGEAKLVLGVPLPRAPQGFWPCLMLRRAWSVLARDASDHTASGLALSLAVAFPGFFASLTAPYGAELFGSLEDGNRLAELYVSVNGLVGLLLAPFCGMFADACGLRSFTIVLLLTQLVATGTVGMADWTAQMACAMSLVLFNTLFQIFISRYLLQYAPPNRIGTVQGLYVVMAVAVSLPLSVGAFVAAEMLPAGVDAYRWPMWACGGLGAFALLLYSCYICRAPPPEVPALLADDEAELARQFGCGTLEEVMEVVGSATRKELFKELSSTDPDVLRKLIRSINTEKMLEKMAELPLEDIAKMMEEGLVGEEEEDEEIIAEAAAAGDIEAPAGRDAAAAAESAENRKDEGGSATDKTGAEPTPERTSERCDELAKLIDAENKEGLKSYITEHAEELWAVALLSEERWTESEQRRRDRELGRLIPGGEFAKILRQRPELRAFAQRQLRRELDRKIASMRGTKKAAATSPEEES